MTTADASHVRARRRLIILCTVLALVALFVVGAVVMVPIIGRELGDDVLAVVAADGVDSVVFHGQDGELHCTAPLADPDAVVAAAEGVDGVHDVQLDESCVSDGGGESSTTAPTIAPTTTSAPTTTPASSTTTSTTTTSTGTTSTTTIAPATEPLLEVVLSDGVLLVHGGVATDAQAARLRAAATSIVDVTNLVDELTVDPAAPVDDLAVERIAGLIPAMPPQLVSAIAAWDGTDLTVQGQYALEEQRAAFAGVADFVAATATLEQRPTAAAADIDALETELNAIVAATPLLFDKGSTHVSPASAATLQRIAGIAERYGGVAIEVQGHTDSEGDAGRNLTLSQQRAESVVAALVALGVPAFDLTAVGYGETQLILDANGTENREASRRVVFATELVG